LFQVRHIPKNFTQFLLKGFFLACLFISFELSAQVRLTVYNDIDNTPIPFTPVKWKLLNNGQVLQSQTNDSGKIAIYTQGSPVSILISFLGFEIKKDTFYKDGDYSVYLKQDIKYLPEAVITDQYTATNPEKSINKVIVIDQKKIKAMAAVNLNDVLSNQLNVKLGQDNLLGSSLSLMGISGQNVKILLDGVPVIGRQNGNIDLSQINMNDIERIEIIEGPLSVAYGTNALAGAINIITKKKLSHKVELSTQAYYESVGKYNANMNLGLRKTNGIYHISLGRNYFDGWSAVEQSRYQDWKPKEQYFGRFQYLRKIGLFDLNLKSEGFSEKISNKGIPRRPYQETAFDEYYYTRRFDNTLIATSKLPENRYLNLIVGYNIYSRVKNRYLFNRVTLDKTLVPEQNEQDTNYFKSLVLRGTYTKSLLNARLNYQLGYDINSETGSGKKLIGSFNSITDYAGFLSLEISPNSKLNIKPGVRYSFNTVYRTSPLPSLNIKYVQKKGYTFRMSYARGFRAPDLKELYLYFVDVNHNVIGNPDLKPENSNNFQWAVTKKKVIRKTILQPELAFFYNSIQDRIILTNVQDLTFTYKNLENFQSFNTNLSLNFKSKQLSGDIGYALNTISTSKKHMENAFSSHEITANLIYQWKKPDLNIAFFIKSTSQTVTFVLDEIGETRQGKTDGYVWMDLTFSKSLLNKKWNLGGGIKNLGGITNINTTGNIGGVHSTGSNSLLFGTGRVIFIKLDYYFIKK